MANIKLLTGGVFVLIIILLLFLSYKKGEETAKNACLLQKNIETVKIQEKIIYVKENQEKLVANIKNVANINRLKFMQSLWQERTNLN